MLLHRAKDSGTYEMLMDLFRKSGVSAKVIMHITQPGVILDWLEDGLEAATLLPSSEVNAEKLPHCYVVDVFPSPQIFYPALVKLPSMPYLPALMDIIAGVILYRAEGVEIREKRRALGIVARTGMIFALIAR